MSRIRTIKPEFFRHEQLYEAERDTGLPLRLAFAGLWTVADREGRFRWQPRILKLDVLPFDEIDFGAVLNALAERGFIVRYGEGGNFAHIPTWAKHQHINVRETGSTIPTPDEDGARTCDAPDEAGGEGERELEGKGKLPDRTNSVPSVVRSQASRTSVSTSKNGQAEEGSAAETSPLNGHDRYPSEFEELWREYRFFGNKNATKDDAYRAWKKLSTDDRSVCLIGLARYGIWLLDENSKRAAARRSPVEVKHLSRFINVRGWEPFMEEEQHATG